MLIHHRLWRRFAAEPVAVLTQVLFRFREMRRDVRWEKKRAEITIMRGPLKTVYTELVLGS